MLFLHMVSKRKPFCRNFSQKYKTINRKNLPDMLCKKIVLSNFAKFTGKHLCQSLFFWLLLDKAKLN